MLPLAVTKKWYRHSEAEDVGFGTVFTEGCSQWDYNPTITARMPSSKAGTRAAQGNCLQRSRLLTNKPIWPQAWKLQSQGKQFIKFLGYLVKNNLQEARGDALGIQRNFSNSLELWGQLQGYLKPIPSHTGTYKYKSERTWKNWFE